MFIWESVIRIIILSYFALLFDLFNFREIISVEEVIVIYICTLQDPDYLQLVSHKNRGGQGLTSDPCSQGSG
jgi:hypothetical protein